MLWSHGLNVLCHQRGQAIQAHHSAAESVWKGQLSREAKAKADVIIRRARKQAKEIHLKVKREHQQEEGRKVCLMMK